MNLLKLKNLLINQQEGMTVLLVVIILAAAVLIMATSATFLGLGELEMGYTAQQGETAFAAADGCLEEALRRLRLDTNYSGGTLALGNGSCIIETTGAGNNRTIIATSTISNYSKTITAQLTLSGNIINIDSWQEK